MSSTAVTAVKRGAPGQARRSLDLEKPGRAAWSFRIILLVLYLLPMLWLLLTSLEPPGNVGGSAAEMFLFRPTLESYQAALSGGLLNAVLQSLMIASGTTAITLLLALPAAYGLAQVTGRVVVIGLGALVGLQMLPQTATIIPLFQVFGAVHLLNTQIAVILADTALLAPWATLILRPFFKAVPTSLEEAAALDGASQFRTFTSVCLPIARNGAATVGTLIFMISWGEFLYAINLILSPGKYPISALLAEQISQFSSNWPNLMALAVVTAIPIMVLFVFTYRFLRSGLTLGAVK
ncbi:MAG TPA: carbohydrate ABC transporter permease [Acidimicrobiales bacterium]|nr:carbohydrate ABC transporter permease [Acidimicrobiales bacterium]